MVAIDATFPPAGNVRCRRLIATRFGKTWGSSS
jgi:hypothetical protein